LPFILELHKSPVRNFIETKRKIKNKRNKKMSAKYYSAILIPAVLTLLSIADFQTNTRVAGKITAQQGVRNERAIKYLKQTGSYDSLAEAIKDTRFAENPSASDLLFIQRQKLTASDGVDNDLFGTSVAVSGDTAVVGAKSVNNKGAAYVFVRSGNTWTQQAKLVDPFPALSSSFGHSVAISGDTIIVGEPLYGRESIDSIEVGIAYAFVRSNGVWSYQNTFYLGSQQEYNFGYSVSISSDTAVIGAWNENAGSNTSQGAAYVFVRSGNTWTQQQRLTAATGVTNSFFGKSVSISGSTLLVGANNDSSNPTGEQGFAYVFTRSGTTWAQQARLSASDGVDGDFFGESVDLSLTINGAVAVVGAHYDDVSGNETQGSAYVFNRSQFGTWSQTQKLTAADGDAHDRFGRRVAITPTTGSTIIVDAAYDDVGANVDQGSAYVFRRVDSVWTQQQKLTAADGAHNDAFGSGVAVSGEVVIIGSSLKTINGNFSQGAAYVFNLGGASPSDFDGDGKTDVSIFRPSNGNWWYFRSSDSVTQAAAFGESTDRIAPGDFTGDGKTDIALFRPSNGNWFILRSEDGSFFSFPFGTSGDIPTPADYDGDGKADAAVFRPSDSTWYIRRSSDLGASIVTFGISTDKPVPADYDGDGKADIAIFRPSDGSWWYLRSTDLQYRVYRFGVSTDKPVPGDWTGDGKADIAFFRPSTGEWFVQRSEDNSFYSVPFGTTGDAPVPADYDGDGRFDTAVFRPSDSTWYINRSSAGIAIQQFGLSTDKPVPGAFVP
jgi:hypothetical protein